MPSGDAHRTWFLDMVEALRSRWRLDLSLDKLIGLRDQLDAMLHRIRSARNLPPPVVTHPRCGRVSDAAEPYVTVRALILRAG